MYSLISTFLGRWVDKQLRGKSGVAAINQARDCLKYVGGVHFTILSVIIIAATFIPRGSFSFNPKAIDESLLKSDEESDVHSDDDIKEIKYQQRDSFAPQDITGDAVGALAQNTAARVHLASKLAPSSFFFPLVKIAAVCTSFRHLVTVPVLACSILCSYISWRPSFHASVSCINDFQCIRLWALCLTLCVRIYD